jgi:sugar lactone lactonase YvrE
MQPRVLLDGLAMPESPRWHDDRLWLSNWGTRQIIAVDLDGDSEIAGEGPDGLGWATNWLPDGRMLVTGPELIRVEPDGSRVRHADLSHISPLGWSEITVDGRGNAYVNTINFDFAEFNEVLTSGQAPGEIALVTADGEAREVANELAFPNGMVITPDNKTLVVAESRRPAHRLRHRRRRQLVEPSRLGRRRRAGRHLPRRRRLHLGFEREHGQRLRPYPRGR